ncbi:hypothetical protein BJ170DRAFT_601656 [Xylariales sp. AK1849]|nr:hypothetical protein BJ170DRAFT_601656 [Xylariales sp. AK1849]
MQVNPLSFISTAAFHFHRLFTKMDWYWLFACCLSEGHPKEGLPPWRSDPFDGTVRSQPEPQGGMDISMEPTLAEQHAQDYRSVMRIMRERQRGENIQLAVKQPATPQTEHIRVEDSGLYSASYRAKYKLFQQLRADRLGDKPDKEPTGEDNVANLAASIREKKEQLAMLEADRARTGHATAPTTGEVNNDDDLENINNYQAIIVDYADHDKEKSNLADGLDCVIDATKQFRVRNLTGSVRVNVADIPQVRLDSLESLEIEIETPVHERFVVSDDKDDDSTSKSSSKHMSDNASNEPTIPNTDFGALVDRLDLDIPEEAQEILDQVEQEVELDSDDEIVVNEPAPEDSGEDVQKETEVVEGDSPVSLPGEAEFEDITFDSV